MEPFPTERRLPELRCDGRTCPAPRPRDQPADRPRARNSRHPSGRNRKVMSFKPLRSRSHGAHLPNGAGSILSLKPPAASRRRFGQRRHATAADSSFSTPLRAPPASLTKKLRRARPRRHGAGCVLRLRGSQNQSFRLRKSGLSPFSHERLRPRHSAVSGAAEQRHVTFSSNSFVSAGTRKSGVPK